MSGDRTAEIWSTRLQRELLSLTASEGATDEKDKESSSNTSDAGILPPFVEVIDHSLDIVKATCEVTFQIKISDNSNKEKTKDQSKDSADETTEEQQVQDTNEPDTDAETPQ